MALPAGGAAAVAGAPPATVYHQCSPDQWDAWYTLVTGLGDGAEPFELLVTLAQELRNEGVPFAEKWGESPNALQLGRLRVQLRQADIRIDDILTTMRAVTRARRPSGGLSRGPSTRTGS
jgi:hypothetical protein